MITPDGWFDFAVRDPGYPGAVNGGVNALLGVVPHSAEGYFASIEALHDFHWGRATAPPGQRASWAATNLKDGRFVQHYPIYAQTWTSGATYPNDNFFAFENEGRAGEPLTDAQVANIVRVIREISELKGWEPRRPTDAGDMQATLYEHREMVRWGALPTACPSGRIPWDALINDLLGGRMYDDQTIDAKFLKAIAFLQGQMKDDRNELAAAIAELAQANATSFKGIEDRLAALEGK